MLVNFIIKISEKKQPIVRLAAFCFLYFTSIVYPILLFSLFPASDGYLLCIPVSHILDRILSSAHFFIYSLLASMSRNFNSE